MSADLVPMEDSAACDGRGFAKRHILPKTERGEVGRLPADWRVFKLADLCTTSSGTTPSRKKKARYFHGGTVHWVKTLDLNNSKIVDTEERVTELALRETALSLYSPGTVLIAMYGGFNQIGRTGLLEIAATVNQAITAIQARSEVLNPEFLLAMLNYHVDHWRSVASSSRKDPNITSRDIRNFEVACPVLSEQKAIAEALSGVDGLLGSLDALIAKKRAIKQAAMQQLLTGKTRLPGFRGEWDNVTLGRHLVFLRNGVHSRDELTSDGRVKYLHYGDIHTSTQTLLDARVSPMPYLPEELARTLDRLKSGDLIFVDASEDLDGVGKSVEILDTAHGEMVAGLHTIAIRFDRSVLADGFKAYLQFCPAFRHRLKRLAAGTKVFATNRIHIAGVEMPLPQPDEQTAIAAVLSDMDAEIAALERRRDKTRAIKQGMMQQLLTGRIRLVKPPKEEISA